MLSDTGPLALSGYVYDAETGLYYLQSRYYNPEVGRFINADAFASTGQGILGNNMFAYCGNNPVNMVDPSGCVYIPIIKLYEAWYKKLEEIIQENFEHNSKMDSDPETTTHNKIINDQNGATGKNFEYGNYLAEWNGCEAIAIHNARVALGMKSSLSKIMLKCQMNMGMIGDGFFGTNPLAIGDILSDCGMEYSRVGLSEMTQEGVYIISYWNPGMPFNGLHTVAVLYDGETYTTYNRGTGQSTVPPSSYATQFICGYYLGGKA